jgi:hypothetical protein
MVPYRTVPYRTVPYRTVPVFIFILTQGGMTTRDWFSEQELRAFAISMVTRMDRAIVMASGA